MTHTYKGKLYKFLFLVKMKVEQGWVKAVVYQDEQGERYCRPKTEFDKRFIKKHPVKGA